MNALRCAWARCCSELLTFVHHEPLCFLCFMSVRTRVITDDKGGKLLSEVRKWMFIHVGSTIILSYFSFLTLLSKKHASSGGYWLADSRLTIVKRAD